MAEGNSGIPALAAAAEPEKKDDGTGEKDGAVREAAHAAAEIEADATIAAARAEEEAKKLARDAGAEAAEKWLEKKLKEIDGAAQSRMDALKTWFEDRFKSIEEKLKLSPGQGESAGAAPNGNPPTVAPAAKSEEKKTSEPAKQKRRRI